MQEYIGGDKTGNKSTCVVKVELYIEVDDSTSYADMTDAAKERVKKHIIESKGFFPFRVRCDKVFRDVTVDELRYVTVVSPKEEW